VELAEAYATLPVVSGELEDLWGGAECELSPGEFKASTLPIPKSILSDSMKIQFVEV